MFDEDPGLVSRTPVITAIAANRMRLASAAGVERGTVLEILDAAGTVATTVKVQAIERATGEATLDAGVLLTAAQMAAINLVAGAFVARSRWNSWMIVRLLKQPDPLVPGSAEDVLDTTESATCLSTLATAATFRR